MLQPLLRVAASITTVAASVAYGCSLYYLRLQVRFDWHHKAQPALRVRARPEAVAAAMDAFGGGLLEVNQPLTRTLTRTLALTLLLT